MWSVNVECKGGILIVECEGGLEMWTVRWFILIVECTGGMEMWSVGVQYECGLLMWNIELPVLMWNVSVEC